MSEINFEDYEKLIAATARKAYARLAACGVVIEYEDVFQEMCIGFINARDGFDESKGFKFSTYLVRTLYLNFNRFAEPMIAQRALIWSLDEMSVNVANSRDDTDDALDALDFLNFNVDESQDPLTIVERKHDGLAKLRALSNDSKRIVRSFIVPEAELIEHHEAVRAQIEHGRNMGVSNKKLPEKGEMSLNFIMDFHSIKSRARRNAVKQEILRSFGGQDD